MSKSKSSPASKAKTKKFTINPICIDTPRRYKLGASWVGVGGPIVLEAKPPAIPRTIKEATDAQYLKIAENCPYLVKLL